MADAKVTLLRPDKNARSPYTRNGRRLRRFAARAP